MKITPRKKRGFTLVELTVVIVFGLALSSAGMLLLQQQITTIRIFNEQDFILKEAPSINNSLTSLLDRADAIRLHNNFEDAVRDQNPVITDGKTLVAAYRNIDNSTTFGVISLQTIDGDTRLNYYFLDPDLPLPTAQQPSWTISREVVDADFDLVEGLFQATLTGPAAESITYTISPNQ